MLALAAAIPLHCLAADQCGDLRNAIGPFDYRTATAEQRDLVERFHFRPEIENLTNGSVVGLAGDISYTLRVFPNHPRALMSMADLALKENLSTPKGSQYSVECWFQRAVRFRPDDGEVRLVFGVTLLKSGNVEAAIKELSKANELMPNSANVHYNLGLAYVDAKDYPHALEHAKAAYALGFPLPGLKDKLKRANEWKD